MTDENESGRRSSRNRGPNTARASAIDRLKAIRSGSKQPVSQIKIEKPIYDTVDEVEYDTLVAKRKDEFQGFIVDDQGFGYGDDGHEEDWSVAGGGDLSEDEEKVERKKREVVKKPSPLVEAAAMMGKQKLSNMFTSSAYKTKNLSGDSIVDEVIAEFAPDESDREKRRRARLGSNPSKLIKKENHNLKKKEIPNPMKEEIPNFINGDKPNLGNECSSHDEEMMLEIAKESEPSKEIEMLISRDLEEKVPACVVEKISVRNGESGVKESFVLNARVREEKDPALSATAGWQAVRNAGNGADMAMSSVSNGDEKPDFVVDSEGSLPFYILDAHEEFYGANVGNLYLFGKVKTGSAYHSCCVVVKNMQRCVYAIPKGVIFKDDEIRLLEEDVKKSRISSTAFRTKLQEMASELKSEIAKQLLDRNVSSFSMTPVKRNYAFERSDIPSGENYALKINYPFKDPPLSSDLNGEMFSALLGTHSSALELFLVKRKIKGPSWLSVSKFSTCSAQRVSWCKFEVVVDCPKDIQVSASSKTIAEIPPVVVTAINVKTIISAKHNTNEIVSASLVCCHKAKIDAPTLASEWTRPGMLSHFAVVRKLDGGIFPMGFSKEVSDRNTKAGQNVISIESSERALLNRLMIELYKLDSDVLLGHNISGFDLDVLLHRAQACRVPSNMWSKIGRLKRAMMPKLSKSNTTFGSGASPGVMSCMAGRLLCDTFLCSRDLLREVSYSLTHLTKTQLNKDRKEIAPNDLHLMFQSSEKLLELIECCETDAWLSMELMFHLSILPLTRQLTNISGNLWGKTLQGARAQRVEYLLLHAFHAKKFMVPDKYSSPAKETKVAKRKMNDTAVEKDIDVVDVENTSFEDNALQGDLGKAKKGPAYLGGLVLEPKKGLYDKYILLLDFNSLYPSIIQEYNICFTTVERSLNESTVLPTSNKTGVLPELLKNLVERRRMVKTWLKSASGLKAQQLDIQQQALKLTANSMYGCLGFSNSRFYAKPLAEMITLQGREILQSTVDLVQNKLNLEVIYGDTDSIMIYSGLDDIAKAKSIAGKVIHEVNQKYKCLEIDLDGLYKRMLLLKKKKYAAVKVQFKDGLPYEVIERKGLDMVRRDWSLLSKELGDFCLSQILSGGSCEDVVESIHSALMKVKEDTRSGQVPLEKYVITKTLTKPPEAYPDGKNQPHVEVALRMKKSGYSSGCSAGDTVPYVICSEQGTSSSNNTGIAQRARHPEELKKDNVNWIVDIDYYLSQQIHPVVSRLCASIQGTSPARLADCLGLDSSKFQSKPSEAVNSDPSTLFLCGVDDDERYAGCEPLVLSCPSCSNTFDCPSVSSSVLSSINEDPADSKVSEASKKFWCKLRCPKCPEEGDAGRMSPALIANLVKRQADGFINTYYKGLMTCDDETCKYTTRSLNLRVLGDSERGTICPNYPRCTGHLIRKYTEADLYKQLSYFCYVFDTIRCLDKVEQKIKLQVERELAKLRPVVELAASTAQKIRDRCAFGWVQLKDLFEIF